MGLRALLGLGQLTELAGLVELGDWGWACGIEAPVGLGRANGCGTGRAEGAGGALWTMRAGGAWKIGGTEWVGGAGGRVGSQLTLLGLWQALKALQEMSSATPATPPQPLSRKAKSIPVQTFEVSHTLPPALPPFAVLGGFQHQLSTSSVTLRAQTPRCLWGRPDARRGAGVSPVSSLIPVSPGR